MQLNRMLLSFVLIIGSLNFSLASFFSTPVYADEASEIVPIEFDVELKPLALLHITGQNSFKYYLNESLYNLLSGNGDNPDDIYESLAQVSMNNPMILFIQDGDILDSLKSEDVQALKDQYSNSSFMGIGSQSGRLKSLLGITVGADFNELNPIERDGIFFVHKSMDGKVNELFLNDITDPQEALQQLTHWYRALYSGVVEDDSIASQPSGAWNAAYTADHRGKLKGGTYRFLINGFKLDSPADKPDYYLLTTSIQTDITSHSCDALKGHCGWFSDEMYLSVKVDTSNGGELYEYMPTGSVGTSTKGFTIGGQLTTSQIGLSGAFSETYSISDATYIDNSDYVTNDAKWTIRFKKPDYTWFPFIIDAPNVAKNSYETHPALITEVPKGQCAKVSIYPYILQAYDTFKFYVFALKVTENYSDWYSKTTPLPKTVVCGSS